MSYVQQPFHLRIYQVVQIKYY